MSTKKQALIEKKITKNEITYILMYTGIIIMIMMIKK